MPQILGIAGLQHQIISRSNGFQVSIVVFLQPQLDSASSENDYQGQPVDPFPRPNTKPQRKRAIPNVAVALPHRDLSSIPIHLQLRPEDFSAQNGLWGLSRSLVPLGQTCGTQG